MDDNSFLKIYLEKQNKFISLVKDVQYCFNTKLYKQEGYTFNDYIKMKWNVSLAQAYRYIMCAKVIDQLEEFEIKPSYESLCKSLFDVAKAPIQMKLLWSTILEKTNGRPDCINSTHVNQYWKELCMNEKYSHICNYTDENDIMLKIEKSLNRYNEKKQMQMNLSRKENEIKKKKQMKQIRKIKQKKQIKNANQNQKDILKPQEQPISNSQLSISSSTSSSNNINNNISETSTIINQYPNTENYNIYTTEYIHPINVSASSIPNYNNNSIVYSEVSYSNSSSLSSTSYSNNSSLPSTSYIINTIPSTETIYYIPITSNNNELFIQYQNQQPQTNISPTYFQKQPQQQHNIYY